MSDITDNIYNFQAAGRAPCRMAYIINNRQPVKCSIISDQPLFYMDFEQDDEDAALESAFDFAAIESGVEDLQARIAGLEARSLAAARAEGAEFELFLDACAALGAEDGQEAPPDIRFLENTLRQSRLAAAFLDFAARHGTRLCYDAQVVGTVYDRRGGQIHINPHLHRTEQILLAARELRRVWQHRHGALLNPLTFHPDQAILVNRAQIADLAVIMVRVAWELQLAGEKAPWARIENGGMGDLARGFARESFLDFRTLNNGVAQSAVFECWFLSERCRNEDKRLIQQMLADYHGYVFDTAQSSQSVTAELIIALGSMPFGKNYLAPYVRTITGDAIFTEVRDRSNANFLWFIKFERSFRETEQELQIGQEQTGQTKNHRLGNPENTRFGDHETASEIIPLPQGGVGAASARRAASGGNIIPFNGGVRPGERSGGGR